MLRRLSTLYYDNYLNVFPSDSQTARVKGFFGGTITSYSEMMVDSSAEATYNLMREAKVRLHVCFLLLLLAFLLSSPNILTTHTLLLLSLSHVQKRGANAVVRVR